MIRKMVQSDIQQVAALEKECFSKPWSENAISKEVDNKNAIFFVYEEQDRILGYAGMYLIIDEGDILNVAVTANSRNKGIARQILLSMFEKAESMGIHKFTLEVRKSNQFAIRLYEKLGFITEGCRKNFYDDPQEDGLIMWKKNQ